MIEPTPSFSVNVDPTNPGQFFACCGLLELADRLWRSAEGWFAADGRQFHIACGEHSLKEFLDELVRAPLTMVDSDDVTSTPFKVGAPFRELIVDWWVNDQTGARDLKVWAGRMESCGIAVDMQYALRDPKFATAELFEIGMVVTNFNDPSSKREPYYYDARRAPNAHSRDVGYSANDLGITTVAHPAVELLCVIGIQVARPAFTKEKRIYDYTLWTRPLPTNMILAVATGSLGLAGSRTYRFENWFRTGQKKHKAFRSAIPLNSLGDC